MCVAMASGSAAFFKKTDTFVSAKFCASTKPASSPTTKMAAKARISLRETRTGMTSGSREGYIADIDDVGYSGIEIGTTLEIHAKSERGHHGQHAQRSQQSAPAQTFQRILLPLRRAQLRQRAGHEAIGRHSFARKGRGARYE